MQCSNFVSPRDTEKKNWFSMTRNELMTYKVSNLNNINIFRNQITSSVFPEMNKNIPQVSR